MQQNIRILLVPFLALFFMLSSPFLLFAGDQEIIPDTVSGKNNLVRMTDNFFILYDPSTSMDVPYKDTGLTRIEAQKKILRESNASLPELGWQAGLYPHWKGGMQLHGTPMGYKPYYPLHRYDKEELGAAIEKLPTRPQGPPMMQVGLMKMEHLLGLPGQTDIFIFSDGKHFTYPSLETRPLDQAKKLNDAYNVCFNIVSSAKQPEDRKLLDDIANVNDCSQVIDFDTVYDNPEHLFGKLYRDAANNNFDNILFDFDKSNIKPQYASILDELGTLLKQEPNIYAVLSGHTCIIGTKKYNINLSRRRAERAQKYLINKFNISPERVLLYWYGFSNPVASNKTEAGRKLNRRVTITLRKK